MSTQTNDKSAERHLEGNDVASSSVNDCDLERNEMDSDSVGCQAVEIFSEDVTNQLVESLLGSSSDGNITRNYDSYNRMEGCSSDEETQTDNDDDNSIEKNTDADIEHHYTELQNDISDFGEFTAAPLNTLENTPNNYDERQVNMNHTILGPSMEFDHTFEGTGVECDKTLGNLDHHTDTCAMQIPWIGIKSGHIDESQPYVSIPPLTAGVSKLSSVCHENAPNY